MSDLSNVLEKHEGDNQLSIAIKMIISAFENQNSFLNTEIGRLVDELAKTNTKIFELESKCSSLIQDKDNNEHQLASLMYQNEQLSHQFQELNIENTKLKSIKNTIIATIEKTDKRDLKHQDMNQEELQDDNNQNENKQTVKFCKPQIFMARNYKHHYSIDNLLEDYPNDSKLFANKNKSYLYNPSQGNSNSNNNNNSNSRNFSHQSNFNIPGRMTINSHSNSNNKGNYHLLDNEMGSDGMRNNKNGKNSNFFKNCRKTIDQPEYKELIQIVRAFNTKNLSKQDTFIKITKILELKYPDLFEEFKMLFVPNE